MKGIKFDADVWNEGAKEDINIKQSNSVPFLNKTSTSERNKESTLEVPEEEGKKVKAELN